MLTLFRVSYNIIGIMHYANYALYYATYLGGVFSMDSMHNVHNVVMSSKAWANRPTSPHIGPFSFENLV